MGVVYEAEQISLGRRVALKILPFAALLSETQLERFATEATAAARLQHDHIVQVYSVGCERGIHYYSMQLIDGPSIADVIAEMRNERHPGDEDRESADTVVARRVDVLTRDEDGGHYRAVARIGREAAEALYYAHENGVLHRDIKPSNLLLDKSGQVWITDFGLARVEDESQLTRTGDILGTLRYASPQQATGKRVDARSDVYSLGATLYELATLKPVFDNADRREVIKQVVAGNPVAPHTIDDRISKPLSYVISKAMARRLEDRYESAQEMADDLQRFLDGEPVKAKPSTLLRRARAWSRRHRLASTGITGLLIVALLLPFAMHYFFQKVSDDSQSKEQGMNVSQTAKVAAAAAAMAIVTAGVNAKTPVPPPPDPGLTVSHELSGVFLDLETAGGFCEEGGLIQQTDGKFLNVGAFWGQDPTIAQAIRWNIDGSVDASFGNDEGRLIFDVGTDVGRDVAKDVVVQPDGKIVMVGTCNEFASPWIARLNPDGSFDSDFGNAGVVDDLFEDAYVQFRQVTSLSDDCIVAIGCMELPPWSLILVKFLPDGTLDESFGTDGVSIVDLGDYVSILWGNGFTELPDGRLVAPGCGLARVTSAVIMFNANGSLDTSFGNGGFAEIDLQPGGAEFFHSLVIQPDGKIVAVGGTSTDPSRGVVAHHDGFIVEQFSIARFNADGRLDTSSFVKSFGGIQLDLAGGGEGHFTSVELLSDGKILAVGHGRPTVNGDFDIYLARFQANGTLDESFDDDGWINVDIMDNDMNPGLVVIDDHHYMVGATGWIPDPQNGTPYLVRFSEE